MRDSAGKRTRPGKAWRWPKSSQWSNGQASNGYQRNGQDTGTKIKNQGHESKKERTTNSLWRSNETVGSGCYLEEGDLSATVGGMHGAMREHSIEKDSRVIDR
ncbi:hypothetical protein ACKLNR_002341 [Fusarium oxysporum f. sp. zingiberi]